MPTAVATPICHRAEELVQHGHNGLSRDVTMLFADLRDFTALSESLDGQSEVHRREGGQVRGIA